MENLEFQTLNSGFVHFPPSEPMGQREFQTLTPALKPFIHPELQKILHLLIPRFYFFSSQFGNQNLLQRLETTEGNGKKHNKLELAL